MTSSNFCSISRSMCGGMVGSVFENIGINSDCYAKHYDNK